MSQIFLGYKVSNEAGTISSWVVLVTLLAPELARPNEVEEEH